MNLDVLNSLTHDQCHWIGDNLNEGGTNAREVFREFFHLDQLESVPVDLLEDFVFSYIYHHQKYHDKQTG